MDTIHHMSLSGHAETIPLTAPAHARLVRYLADTRAAFAADPDGDETVRDLETTLGDRLRTITDANGTAVGDEELAEVLAETGYPEREAPAVQVIAYPARGGFFCRINEGKWFGGICAGLAARGDFSVDWTRTVALFLLLFTGGTVGLVYLALMLILPRVESVDEYHRLCGAPLTAPGLQ